MRRSTTFPPLLLVLAALTASGCGDDDKPSAAAPTPASTPARATDAPALVAIDGRLGDAVTATDADDDEQLLDGGGEFPSAILEDPTDAAGVAGATRCPDPDLVPSATNLRRVARATFCMMNGERRRRGLPVLKRNRRLARASVRHSRDMVRRRYFAHDSLSGRRLRDRLRAVRYIPRRGRWIVGENLAWGAGAVAAPRAIVRAWMASPGHRRNLLSAKYSSVGLGIVHGTPKAKTGGATYTTDFGRLP